MNRARYAQTTLLALVAALVLAAVLVAGCGGGSQGTNTSAANEPKGPTALDSLSLAQSKLTTAAPDGKLLLVQTTGPTATTATPVWAYLFGSPKTSKLFVVQVNNGKAEGPSPYGTAEKDQIDWAKVPPSSEINIDSNEAYSKALTASKAKGTPAYMMGLLTYVPSSQATSTAEPMVWNVQLDPSAGFNGIVRVDAIDGKVTTAQ